jgi:hypothetical protein
MADRYEFRCWGDDFSAQLAILERDWTPLGEDRSDETYLLGGSDRFSLKIRAGRFEVKEKLKTEGRLELWRPVAGIAFPLSMDELAPWLEQAFGLTGAATQGEEEVGETALPALLARHGAGQALPVEKHRKRYGLAGVLAEHVTVAAAGRRLQCMAAEGEEPTLLFTGLRLLHVEERQTLSYPARLLQLAKPG